MQSVIQTCQNMEQKMGTMIENKPQSQQPQPRKKKKKNKSRTEIRGIGVKGPLSYEGDGGH